jgi:hypothetical protein
MLLILQNYKLIMKGRMMCFNFMLIALRNFRTLFSLLLHLMFQGFWVRK